MKLGDLKQALRVADPGAVLVSQRVLNRVIQQSRKLPGWLWEIPHAKSFVIDRHELFQYVEQDDLDLAPDELLPATVILLARPPLEDLGSARRGPLLLKYWRSLFHANVHLHLEKRSAEGHLGTEEIRQRIAQLGQTEFEEIRLILRQDHYLLPPFDERGVYIEFAAVFLELRCFAANLLPIYFPGLRDFEAVARLLGEDVDAPALFHQTRPPGAPDPVPQADNLPDESDDYYWKLVRAAIPAARAGNTVRAAILRMRAARVAPASLTTSTQHQAEADLTRLARRLQAALRLSDAETAEWEKDLPALLNKADQGTRPVEAALLFDLQKVCLEHEREIYALDLVEWVLSGGKRPIKRPLPGQRLVRIIKHLRSAGQRLTMARLTDTDRFHLDGLLQAALNQTESQLRVRFRLILTDAFQDAGLRPANTPERTAFAKMIEELLDRITRDGFITFGDLRDTLSRNQLKLPDLADPQEGARGDALTRLDRRLAVLLDGVYQPGEFYQRLLERFTAVAFGTSGGRWLTRFVALPFGGGLALSEGLQLVLEKTGAYPMFLVVRILLGLGFGILLLLMMHAPKFRSRCLQLGRGIGRVAVLVFRDVPSQLLRHPILRHILRSWSVQLFAWYLLQPLVVCGFLCLWLPDLFWPWPRAVFTFVAVTFLLGTRLARAGIDAIIQGLVGLVGLLRAGLVPGLFRLIVRLFKRTIHLLEYVLFTVDEWLCFRTGDAWLSMVVRTVLGVLWYPVSFVIRFYALVLIEPGINPIKFPISSIAAKFIYPFGLVLTGLMSQVLTPLVGTILAHLVAGTTVWLLPDAFGFLVWEMKENWGLYRANRRPLLEPVPVGPHGETVRRLLQPGFHSGTVPKLFARLREAERTAAELGNWRGTRLVRQALQEVEWLLQQFVDRELVTLLQQSGRWQWQGLRPGRVSLSTNRVSLELVHDDFPEEPLRLELEDQAGWLVASVPQPGWLGRLPLGQRQALGLGLSGLYKLAGVDLVREQIVANLPQGAVGYNITTQGLMLWLDRQPGLALVYPLGLANGQLRPPLENGIPAAAERAPDPRNLIFARIPLTWQEWVENWPQGHDELVPTRGPAPGSELLPLTVTLPALPAPTEN